MCALSFYCCGAWSINSEHQLVVNKNAVCLYFYNNPLKQTLFIRVYWCIFSWGGYPPGRLLPMWPPSIRHLDTQLIFQTSNLSSGYRLFWRCLFNSRCAQYRGWTITQWSGAQPPQGPNFDLCWKIRYLNSEIPTAHWIAKMLCQRGHRGYRKL